MKAIYKGESDMYLTNSGTYDVKCIAGNEVELNVREGITVSVPRRLCTIFNECDPLKVSMENMPKMTHEEAVEIVQNTPLASMGVSPEEPTRISLDKSGWKFDGKSINLHNTDIVGYSPFCEPDGEEGITFTTGKDFGQPDPRYNVPKEKPKFSEEEVDAVIAENEIYRRTRSEMERSLQREQVGYGMGKYPEPLTADTWTVIETLGHIKGELMDALHYITMLEIKFEKMGDK